ncbi:hypothetical protein [Clostridium sp.]|uniref:hypothetical protein n=1 Tax=Clostridium sp. TaxID=1506 RepID=UPI002A80137F|nr:hypothetical protein [Clostridium sp.]MDY4251182.1 hypothetical protein [Clostridium sp.]
MKAKSKENKDKSDEFKENYKLVADLKSVYQGLVSILKQHKKMKDNKIVITDDILEQLEKTMMATSILRTLKDEIK